MRQKKHSTLVLLGLCNAEEEVNVLMQALRKGLEKYKQKYACSEFKLPETSLLCIWKLDFLVQNVYLETGKSYTFPGSNVILSLAHEYIPPNPDIVTVKPVVTL